jgi:hypothetical protein
MMDIVISIIFGGMLFVCMMNAGDVAYENRQEAHSTMMVQQELTSIIQLLEGEFRNAGCGLPPSKPTVVQADTSSITFVGDLDGNGGVPDTISYFIGSTADMSSTPNELDRPLYRRINSNSPMAAGVLTVLEFRYFTVSGDELAPPVPEDRLPEIKTIEVSVEAQSPGGVQTEGGKTIFPTSMWQQTRLSSRNSNR